MKGTCESCGNEYERPMRIEREGKTHVYDCFECAVHGLAPECRQCGIKVMGHGIETAGAVFCCAHCVEMYEQGAQVAS